MRMELVLLRCRKVERANARLLSLVRVFKPTVKVARFAITVKSPAILSIFAPAFAPENECGFSPIERFP